MKWIARFLSVALSSAEQEASASPSQPRSVTSTGQPPRTNGGMYGDVIKASDGHVTAYGRCTVRLSTRVI